MKYCIECGSEVTANAKFCSSCGMSIALSGEIVSGEVENILSNEVTSQADQATYSENQASSMNGLAIAGFIVSLIGVFIFALIFGAVGLVLSIVGLQQLKTKHQTGRGLAIAGIVIGSIDIIFAIGKFYYVLGAFLSL